MNLNEALMMASPGRVYSSLRACQNATGSSCSRKSKTRDPQASSCPEAPV